MAEHAAGVTTGWQEKTRAPFFLLQPSVSLRACTACRRTSTPMLDHLPSEAT